jgi:hypothetical protein
MTWMNLDGSDTHSCIWVETLMQGSQKIYSLLRNKKDTIREYRTDSRLTQPQRINIDPDCRYGIILSDGCRLGLGLGRSINAIDRPWINRLWVLRGGLCLLCLGLLCLGLLCLGLLWDGLWDGLFANHLGTEINEDRVATFIDASDDVRFSRAAELEAAGGPKLATQATGGGLSLESTHLMELEFFTGRAIPGFLTPKPRI